jgi:two-component system, LytTR family, response regulator
MAANILQPGGGLPNISAAEVVRVEGMGSYSKVYFANRPRPIILAKVLKHIEAMLPADMFVRTHRAHLINKSQIAHIHLSGADNYIRLHNGETIAISRRRRPLLKQCLTGTIVPFAAP